MEKEKRTTRQDLVRQAVGVLGLGATPTRLVGWIRRHHGRQLKRRTVESALYQLRCEARTNFATKKEGEEMPTITERTRTQTGRRCGGVVLRCQRCGHLWSPEPAGVSGRMPRHYRQCPRGCKAGEAEDKPAEKKSNRQIVFAAMSALGRDATPDGVLAWAEQEYGHMPPRSAVRSYQSEWRRLHAQAQAQAKPDALATMMTMADLLIDRDRDRVQPEAAPQAVTGGEDAEFMAVLAQAKRDALAIVEDGAKAEGEAQAEEEFMAVMAAQVAPALPMPRLALTREVMALAERAGGMERVRELVEFLGGDV